MGKPEYLGKKPRKPSDINLDEGFTAIKAQENKKTGRREIDRQTDREMHTYALTQSYMHISYTGTNAVLWQVTVKASEVVVGKKKKKTHTPYSTVYLQPCKL